MMLIEKTIRDYLSEKLDVPVYCERPEKKPDVYVLVEKTGMTKENLLYTSNITIQSNAASMYEAMSLDEQVRAAMDADEIPDVNLSFDTSMNYTDTATKTYRYQTSYDLYHH